MTIDRRSVVGAGLGLALAPGMARSAAAKPQSFPHDFLWGAATAGHQVEGNNDNADCWVLENVKPTVFAEPSGDADNSLFLWPTDLDIAKGLGLNSYRFSLEWARIEPEPGMFSTAMLDHYAKIIAGCHERGLRPVVTFNHFTTPRWFAEQAGWLNPQAPTLFARFCDKAARHLGAGIDHALTLNEPNIVRILKVILPEPFFGGQRAMLEAAAKATGVETFRAGNAVNPEDVAPMTRNLVAGHKAGRDAIKAVRPDLPVGFTLSMFDDQPKGADSVRDAMREELYGVWLETAQDDDFMGVQNYERVFWGADGRLPPPKGATLNDAGGEIHAPSLANAVRYAHSVTKRPVMVTEHGTNTQDDSIRAALIPAALGHLRKAMADGVPVKGYIHWSLLDNFEWVSGYEGKLGLFAVDRQTFERSPKPSSKIYAEIARRNAV